LIIAKKTQPGNSKETISVFELNCLCYYQSNHSKVEAIPLSALPKDTTGEIAVLSAHYPLWS